LGKEAVVGTDGELRWVAVIVVVMVVVVVVV
jgi:hypothetical protein